MFILKKTEWNGFQCKYEHSLLLAFYYHNQRPIVTQQPLLTSFSGDSTSSWSVYIYTGTDRSNLLHYAMC